MAWGMTMAPMGFFDFSDRYASLNAKKDPLVEIDAAVPWEHFRPTLEGLAQARVGSQVARRAQAAGRDADVQDAGAERALQPVRQPDRISATRPAFFHAVFGAESWGPGARCQDRLALPRGAGAGGDQNGGFDVVMAMRSPAFTVSPSVMSSARGAAGPGARWHPIPRGDLTVDRLPVSEVLRHAFQCVRQGGRRDTQTHGDK